MKKLYRILPLVAALLLIQAVSLEKKGSFDLNLDGTASLPAHTKIPPESLSPQEFGLGFETLPAHTKLPPESRTGFLN